MQDHIEIIPVTWPPVAKKLPSGDEEIITILLDRFDGETPMSTLIGALAEEIAEGEIEQGQHRGAASYDGRVNELDDEITEIFQVWNETENTLRVGYSR